MSRRDHDDGWRLRPSGSPRDATRKTLPRRTDSPGRYRIDARRSGAGSDRGRQRPRARASVRADRHAPAAPRVAHCLALSAGCGRRRRSGTGCVREGLYAHRVVPAESVVRSMADANPDQRLPRSAESPDAPLAMAAAGRRYEPPRPGHDRTRDADGRSIARGRSCWRASGASS